MRVVCSTLQEFLQELEAEALDGRVFRNIVRTTVLQEWEQDEHVSCRVGFAATALIGTDGPDEILEYVEIAGRDGGREKSRGSEKAEQWRKSVAELAGQHGLTMRPGKFELI